MVTLRELGILREVRRSADGPRGGHHAHLQRLPGHGARSGRRRAARRAGRRGAGGHPPVGLDHRLDERRGQGKLHAYGIAPPCGTRPAPDVSVMRFKRPVADPRWAARTADRHTVVTLPVRLDGLQGAVQVPLDCQEPFDYFKPY